MAILWRFLMSSIYIYVYSLKNIPISTDFSVKKIPTHIVRIFCQWNNCLPPLLFSKKIFCPPFWLKKGPWPKKCCTRSPPHLSGSDPCIFPNIPGKYNSDFVWLYDARTILMNRLGFQDHRSRLGVSVPKWKKRLSGDLGQFLAGTGKVPSLRKNLPGFSVSWNSEISLVIFRV